MSSSPSHRAPARTAFPRLATLSAALVAATLMSAQAPSPEPQKTIVKADRLEARNTGVEGHYVFIGHVRITGTNLAITCDRLEIFSVSKPDDAGSASNMPDSGNIRRMLATGNVMIAQVGRQATCNVAEVLPPEDRIILTENPIVSDIATGVTMKGTRMTYYRGERNIDIENPEVVGPALPNLGFPNPEAGAEASPPPATVAPTRPAP